jgi:hypothetical protein
MSNFSSRLALFGLATVLSLGLVACSPEVGSDAWCEKMKETDKGKWTAEDAGNFAKHCIL